MKKKIFLSICLIGILVLAVAPVYAQLTASDEILIAAGPGGGANGGGGGNMSGTTGGGGGNMNGSTGTGFLDNIIEQGSNFGKGDTSGIGDSMELFINDKIVPIVSLIGNLVFAGVTVILGVKYIWSGAEGKSQVAESLPAFVAAVLFFYLGENIVSWLTDAGEPLKDASNWENISGMIFDTINMVVRYAAFGGILYMGLKYMFASAEGKSQMKTSMVGVVLGITFVFMASKVLDFIIDIGEGIL